LEIQPFALVDVFYTGTSNISSLPPTTRLGWPLPCNNLEGKGFGICADNKNVRKGMQKF